MKSDSHILVVDDEPPNLLILEDLLGECYVVHTLNNGKEALDYLTASGPADLVLLDVMMPEMDGFEACRRIKATPYLRDIPVLFLTSLAGEADEAQGLSLGAEDFIHKPFSRAIVLARVRSHLELALARRRLRDRNAELEELVEERTRDLLHEKHLVISGQESARNQLLHSEKLAAIGQLAAGVAHEINNPIAFVTSNLNTLAHYVDKLVTLADTWEPVDLTREATNKPTDLQLARVEADLEFLKEDMGELLRESMDGLKRVRRIVQDLLEFSHVGEAEWQEVDFDACLDSTLNLVRNELKYRVTVEQEYGSPPLVPCIPAQINQVILNLLMNAAQSIEDKGRITIRSGSDDREAWFEVQDSGHGMSEGTQRQIFEPFFTTKPVGKGTGLGLSLSYGIVSGHGGRIEVQSAENRGSTFRVCLPLVRAAINTQST